MARKSHPVLKTIGVIALGLFSIAFIGELRSPVVDAAPAIVGPTAAKLVVSSLKLAEDYEANEVSADMKYKGARVHLVGVVSSVNRDFTNKVWVGVESSNRFLEIHANGLDPERAARLKKGQVISLTCTGAGMILVSPMLDHCE